MSELSELESRLADALARIESAAARVPDPAQSAAEAARAAALEAQLEEERTTNAQLIERVKALKDRQENQVASLEKNLAEAKVAESERNVVQQKLKASIEQLRDQVARLTEANRAMVGDPHLVNTSMMAELEAMRASRRADVAEVDDILAHLAPHVGEPNHA